MFFCYFGIPVNLWNLFQILPKMNTSGTPCEDFWNYACGGWLKDHPTPPEARSKLSQEEEMTFKSESNYHTCFILLSNQFRYIFYYFEVMKSVSALKIYSTAILLCDLKHLTSYCLFVLVHVYSYCIYAEIFFF